MTSWMEAAWAEIAPVPQDMPVPIAPKGANSSLLAPNDTIGTAMPIGTTPPNDIRDCIEERAAIAEFDGGLSRTEAELLARDEIRTCVRCHRDTEGETDAVRVSGGGWPHLDNCHDSYFGFRR
jgi:hypothetical protein